jgi:hypothetical protein
VPGGTRNAVRHTCEALDRTRGGTITESDPDTLTFRHGEQKTLPHTLATTRHLTLTLVDSDADAHTAVFELHNPEAEPNQMVGALIEQHAENAENANERRDKLHLLEKAVPVDTSTVPMETIHCRLHEKLQIGDRLWTVTDIAVDNVTVRAGHDNEADTLVNKLEDVEYTGGITAAQSLNVIDEAL